MVRRTASRESRARARMGLRKARGKGPRSARAALAYLEQPQHHETQQDTQGDSIHFVVDNLVVLGWSWRG